MMMWKGVEKQVQPRIIIITLEKILFYELVTACRHFCDDYTVTVASQEPCSRLLTTTAFTL